MVSKLGQIGFQFVKLVVHHLTSDCICIVLADHCIKSLICSFSLPLTAGSQGLVSKCQATV